MKKLLSLLTILVLAGSVWAGPPITQGINTGSLGAISASSITDTGLTASLPVFTDGSKVLTSNTMTGTGKVVMESSAVMITPTLGAASATSVTIGTNTYWASASAVNDEDVVTLPTVTADYSGHGWVRISAAGVIADSAEFEVGSDGNVSLIRGTANVVVGAACADTKICISTAGAQNPVQVKARNGAGKLAIEFWYH